MTSTTCNPLLWSASYSSPSPIDFNSNRMPPTDCSTAITVRVCSELFNDSLTSKRLSFVIPSSVTKPMSTTPFEESFLQADALPWLEELDIQFSDYFWNRGWNSKPRRGAKHMVTDAGIEVMSHKLRGLRKIDIAR
ncbi:hypothetical protein LOK49_LG14G01600 [Camellia lanceoleosa]|uniref:Uncharacterized protein n=1 Tax=Camellia lanceoleosa TaxID=1840588 RepID=A0ACC0FBL1_9ERIC|nr:hypothetical protein LOK49_LG14G01600 [Camellia lanceoleosa]